MKTTATVTMTEGMVPDHCSNESTSAEKHFGHINQKNRSTGRTFTKNIYSETMT